MEHVWNQPNSLNNNYLHASHSLTSDHRLSNIHYGFNQFLDQISTKSPMTLINELCHLNKIRPEYTLIDVQGPEHAKIFTGA